MSSSKPPTPVIGTVLSERPDGSRLLTISSETGSMEYEFNAAQWQKLGETAQWFEKHVTMIPDTATEEEKTDVQV
jgi:hypothetical protein